MTQVGWWKLWESDDENYESQIMKLCKSDSKNDASRIVKMMQIG